MPGHYTRRMTGPLLDSKLYAPRWRQGMIARPQLVERLDAGIERKLTLVSAPAGFGKTTAIAEWLGTRKHPTAWLSLDEGDNDPTRFWAYVIGALQRIAAGVGTRTLSMMESPTSTVIETAVGALVNDLGASTSRLVLVLDDYHVIESEPVHEGFRFLVEHSPEQLHLTVASRSDPPLPLSRLRAGGELTELRSSDLRFSTDEAAEFLNRVMGLDLAPDDVGALEHRTEGWVAGLQLAALSLQDREDVAGFIAAFAGDDRYIVDYLVEEVLKRQPEDVRRFLLQTSILDRLCGPLCEAVAEVDRGREILEALERENLFVVPLDDKRQWYRYHHLFGEVVRMHLQAEQPGRLTTLHGRASEWYERNELPADAIRHALAAEDFARAAGLIELTWTAIGGTRETHTWIGWAKALPEEVVRGRPVLSLEFAWKLFGGGELEAGAAQLRNAERWLDTLAGAGSGLGASAAEPIVVNELPSLPGSVAGARAFYAQATGDVAGTLEYAPQALELLPPDDYLQRGMAAAMLGLAHWTRGELELAHRRIRESRAEFRKAGDVSSVGRSVSTLADIRATQGRLDEAVRTVEEALQVAAEHGDALVEGTADLYLVLSEMQLERNEVEQAHELLRRSQDLGDDAAYEAYEYRSRVLRGRLAQAEGDLEEAVDLLSEADRINTGGPVPDLRPAGALRARAWIALGRIAEAIDWARDRGLSPSDDLSYLREFEHITLARVLIAESERQGTADSAEAALALLARLREAAEDGGRIRSAIQILVLQALAHEARGETLPGLAALERAMTLAESEGYVQIFVEEGASLRDLLRRAAAAEVAGAFAGRLLEAIGDSGGAARMRATTTGGLLDPLTARETEILRLIAAGLRNQEIADQLVISPATVKRHIANAYGKLDVGHRTEAVARARELNLL